MRRQPPPSPSVKRAGRAARERKNKALRGLKEDVGQEDGLDVDTILLVNRQRLDALDTLASDARLADDAARLAGRGKSGIIEFAD